jgi:lysophospholipase
MKTRRAVVILFMLASMAKLSAIDEQRFDDLYPAEVLPFFALARLGSFTGVGGAAIRYAALETNSDRGALVILPGHSETFYKYAELVDDLRDLGVSFYLMDHRGMGTSERLLADPLVVHVERFSEYVADVRTFVQTVVRTRAHPRLLLFGHSLGGGIAARYLEVHPGDFQAAILSSPMMELRGTGWPAWLTRVYLRTATLLGFGSTRTPGAGAPLAASFEENLVTHSRTRWKWLEEDVRREHPEVYVAAESIRSDAESFTAARLIVKDAAKVQVPVLILQAGDDAYVAPVGQDRFQAAAAQCRIVRLEGARHDLPIAEDPIRDQVLVAMRTFLAGLGE